jgi:hypothetical protein
MNDIIRCAISCDEVISMPMSDDYAIPRLLVSKGFQASGGPIQPKLTGAVGYTVDFESGDRHFFQIVQGKTESA